MACRACSVHQSAAGHRLHTARACSATTGSTESNISHSPAHATRAGAADILGSVACTGPILRLRAEPKRSPCISDCGPPPRSGSVDVHLREASPARTPITGSPNRACQGTYGRGCRVFTAGPTLSPGDNIDGGRTRDLRLWTTKQAARRALPPVLCAGVEESQEDSRRAAARPVYPRLVRLGSCLPRVGRATHRAQAHPRRTRIPRLADLHRAVVRGGSLPPAGHGAQACR